MWRTKYERKGRKDFAVERMARAMAADDMPVEGYKVLAEAALDALVGKK